MEWHRAVRAGEKWRPPLDLWRTKPARWLRNESVTFMIYNADFIWIHVPKCAGTKTENLFRIHFGHHWLESAFSRLFGRKAKVFVRRATGALTGLHQDIADVAVDPTIRWHDSIADREHRDSGFRRGNRAIVCPIRRLPAWLASIYSYHRGLSPHLDHRPERLLEGRFLYWDGSEGHADQVASRYLPDDVLESPRLAFVRTEYFAQDFRKVFGQFLDLSRIPAAELAVKENTSPFVLPDDIWQALNAPHSPVYGRCPIWSRCERVAYGGLA
jgi:hypothetical protein